VSFRLPPPNYQLPQPKLRDLFNRPKHDHLLCVGVCVAVCVFSTYRLQLLDFVIGICCQLDFWLLPGSLFVLSASLDILSLDFSVSLFSYHGKNVYLLLENRCNFLSHFQQPVYY